MLAYTKFCTKLSSSVDRSTVEDVNDVAHATHD